MPQYLYVQAKKLVEETNHKVYVLEWSDIAPIYDVQKNRIKELLPKNFTTLEGTDEEKKDKFFHIISKIKPDIIHLQEHPEMWMPDDVAEELYTIWPRDYKIIETSHDSGFAEELDERMFKAETLVDKTFEYLKYIERNMFKMESSLQIKDLEWLSKNMQKIFIEMQKKVDFKE